MVLGHYPLKPSGIKVKACTGPKSIQKMQQEGADATALMKACIGSAAINWAPSHPDTISAIMAKKNSMDVTRYRI
jgi:hypothetical protein